VVLADTVTVGVLVAQAMVPVGAQIEPAPVAIWA